MPIEPELQAVTISATTDTALGLSLIHISMGLTHEYFAGVLNGIKAQAEMLGYDITFINTSPVGKKLSYLEHCKYLSLIHI